MSFHELIAGYPWLTKRAARVMNTEAPMPKRNRFAYLLAMFVPYAGRLGGGFAVVILVYIVVMLAAIAIPAYHDYTVKAKTSSAFINSQPARDALVGYYIANKHTPESLEVAGISPQLADGTRLSFDPDGMVLTVALKEGELIFTPAADDQGRISWGCTNGGGIKPKQLPSACLQ
jgi:hypothetical protein